MKQIISSLLRSLMTKVLLILPFGYTIYIKYDIWLALGIYVCLLSLSITLSWIGQLQKQVINLTKYQFELLEIFDRINDELTNISSDKTSKLDELKTKLKAMQSTTKGGSSK